MNILLLGSGGRECAIATALVESPKCDRLFIAPGNGGTAELGTNVALDIEDGRAVVDFARENDCELVVIRRPRSSPASPTSCAMPASTALVPVQPAPASRGPRTSPSVS